jgi:hypothetical protein
MGEQLVSITTYESRHFSGVDYVWKEAFPNDRPWNAAAMAIPEKVRFQADLMLVALGSGLID